MVEKDKTDASSKSTNDSKRKSFTISEILQSPMQMVFMSAILFTLGGLVPFTKAGFDFVKDIDQHLPPGYEYPKVSDLWITGVSAIILAVIQTILKTIFTSVCTSQCKEQTNMKVRTIKSEKMGNCTYKSMYFIAATVWGYLVLRDEYYMPAYLGGSGDYNRCMEEYPFAKHSPQMKEYLLVTMGYHVGSFIIHFVGTRNSDFIEMGLHHIVSLYLFGGCYLYNQWECGAVLAFLHDIADIPANIIKTLVESKYQKAAGIFMVTCHMPVWFYTRCAVLPYMIYKVFTIPRPQLIPPIVIPFGCYLLSCMCLLHCYWFCLFIKMIKKYAKDGKAQDMQQVNKDK